MKKGRINKKVLVFGTVLMLIFVTSSMIFVSGAPSSGAKGIKGVLGNLEKEIDQLFNDLDEKADKNHFHNDTYYTESEVDSMVEDLESKMTTPNLNQLVQEFVVAEEESVTAGDVVDFFNGYVLKRRSTEYTFNSVATQDISAAALNSTKFVIVYNPFALIGEVSGSTISFGLKYFFNTGSSYFSVIGLSSTKFVITYSDKGNSYYGTAIVGDVSGTIITFGSEYVYNSNNTFYNSAAALSSTKFVVSYRDKGTTYYGTAVIGDVSGTTITYGSKNVFNSASTFDISTAALSSTKFVVTYRDSGNLNYGTAIIGVVSSTTITFGSEYVFNSAYTQFISTAALSSSKFVATYYELSSNSYGIAIIGNVSGTVITFGTEQIFNYGGLYYISTAALSSSKFVVTFSDYTNYYYGCAFIGDVSGINITFGEEQKFNDDTSYISVIALTTTKFVICYEDTNAGGRAIVGRTMGIYTGSSTVGIAKESKSGGQTVTVIIDGVSDVHSGLDVGEVYYYAFSLGILTTSDTGYKVGLAISETELLLADPLY